MKIFKETQRFQQWWLYVIFALVFTVLILGIYKNSDGFSNFHSPVLILFLLAGIIPMVLILMMKLETRIDQDGIRAKFTPLGISEKFFPWKDIKECYVRKYNPLTEYGGYGVRGIGRKKAFNVSGNLGIQIVTRDMKNFLIGTREPAAARTVIKHYEHKINSQPNH